MREFIIVTIKIIVFAINIMILCYLFNFCKDTTERLKQLQNNVYKLQEIHNGRPNDQ